MIKVKQIIFDDQNWQLSGISVDITYNRYRIELENNYCIVYELSPDAHDLVIDLDFISKHFTLEEAKQAAQQHYEQFILSQIEVINDGIK